MSNVVYLALGLVGGLLMSVGTDLIKDEIKGRIAFIPNIVLRIAALYLPAQTRENIYKEIWLPDLARAVEGTDH